MGEPFTLRHALRPRDVDEIVRLHGEVYAREYGFDETFREYVREPLTAFATGGDGRLWIAEHHGGIVGCIAIVEAPGANAQLRWFLVAPSVRRLGLGRRLMAEALAYCEDRGHERVFLWTVDVLVPAAQLYQAFGFELTEERAAARLWGRDLAEQRYDRALGAGT